jgi:hypothetical protein
MFKMYEVLNDVEVTISTSNEIFSTFTIKQCTNNARTCGFKHANGNYR